MAAKRKYGGAGAMQDTTYIYAVTGLGVVSFLAGVGVFFL